jgi:hypothetical protein
VSALLRRVVVRLRGLGFRERHESQLTPELLARIDLCWSIANGLGVVNSIYGLDFNGRNLLMALAAGEPTRISRAFGIEAIFVSLAGQRARRRTDQLLTRLSQIAERHPESDARMWYLGARGISRYYFAEFALARSQLEEAEAFTHERGLGVAFELDTIRLFRLFALTYLGEVAALTRQVPQLLAEALDRGDMYAATNLQLSTPNLAWLVMDEPDEARRMADDAIARWSHEGFHVQHWYEFTARAQLGLYLGEGAAPYRRLGERWPALRRSMLLRVQTVRVEAMMYRARCALMAADPDQVDRARLVRQAESDARRLLRERTSCSVPLGELILAGCAALRGADERALGHLERAARGFEAAGMRLHTAVARWGRGLLLGGDQGRQLVAEAEAWMTEQRIRRPVRFVAMIAPGLRAE